jgi:hypothetical protein
MAATSVAYVLRRGSTGGDSVTKISLGACIILCLSAAAAPLFLAACSGGGIQITNSGLTCVDDSKECIERRGAALKAMMTDKSRSWIKDPATPAAYASGVRLFAYKSRKRELSCDELAHGKREADAAPHALSGAGAAGLSPAQISRSTMLAAEVSKELATEMKRRCKA